MANSSGGFYSYIEESGHHDAWKIIVLVFVLAAVVILAWVFSPSGDAPTVVAPNTVAPKVVTDADRKAIMATPSGVVADTSKTDAQRTTIMKTAMTKTNANTSLTDEEREAIMRGQ